MRPLFRRAAASAAAAAIVGAAGGIPAARGGDAGALRDRNATIAQQARSAELELYAIQSQLDATRARLASLAVRSGSIEKRRLEVQKRLRAARGTLRAAEIFLGERLRLLYEEGQIDPLEVLLGSTSLEEALSDLDGIQFAAQQDREIIERTLEARRSLSALAKRLEAETARLAALRAATAAEAARLEGAAAHREAFIERLVEERRVNARRIRAIEAQVQAARARTVRISAKATTSAAEPAASPVAAPGAAPPPPPGAAPTDAPPAGGRTMTVVATAYALPGRTATGIPVGWGVVAVDPSVIPLGTRMTIPGYGEGVAADTGSAVRGAKIDVWFPTTRQALAWGVRTVTITLH